MKNIPADYLRKITIDIFHACGAPVGDAEIVADMLVTANLMGLDSHGVIRVPQYVHDVHEGVILPGVEITTLRETSTTAIVDVGWNFGQVGALRATEIAIGKAKANGLGCVTVRRCRHIGCVGLYARLAAEQNFVGMAMCSAATEGHWVSPWGGREGRLGTNPIAFAVPTNGNPIVLDFSTSMAPEGKVRLMLNRGEKLPDGWLVDNSGHPSNNPKDLYSSPKGAILPFGESQGYKGFGLSLMVQILSSLLGEPVWRKEGVESNANLMWFLAINISAFMPPDEFRHEMDEMISYIKSSAKADGFNEILIPGEREFRKIEERKVKGVPVEEETWQQIEGVAKGLGVSL